MLPKNKDGSLDEDQYNKEQTALAYIEYMLRRVANDRFLRMEFKKYDPYMMGCALEYIIERRF